MLAEIASGEVDAAEILFLLAAVMFGVAALVQRADTPAALTLIGWCLLAVGFVVL